MFHPFIIAMAWVAGFGLLLYFVLWLSYIICPDPEEEDSEDI